MADYFLLYSAYNRNFSGTGDKKAQKEPTGEERGSFSFLYMDRRNAKDMADYFLLYSAYNRNFSGTGDKKAQKEPTGEERGKVFPVSKIQKPYSGLWDSCRFSGKWNFCAFLENAKRASDHLPGCYGILAAFLGSGIFVLSWKMQKELRITCLDVGQGDGIVVETPEKQVFLIDFGSSNKKNTAQYQLLPYLKSRGISYIDGIFISHTDGDHISGILEFLEMTNKNLTSIKVGALLLPDWKSPPKAYEDLALLAKKSGIKVIRTGEGDRFTDGETKFSVLAPEEGAEGKNVNEEGMVIELEHKGFRGIFTGDIGMETEKNLLGSLRVAPEEGAEGKNVNEEGMVIELEHKGFRGIFTGDIGMETEKNLLGSLRDVDFLKTAHHGSRYSTGEEFLKQAKPELAVISCSDSNTYGHPSPETTLRLKEEGVQVEYTMKSGAITIGTDGEQIWVERFCEREEP